jgi:eukaryotic-like serine/threonine-protein kinase
MFAEPSRCLDEAILIAFASGSLRGEVLSHAEAHVSGCPACQRMVAAAAAAAHAHDTTDAATSGKRPTGSAGDVEARGVDVPPPGALIAGKYRVERYLGRGGMGSVVSATHVELGLHVAIKFLHREGTELTARFAREGRILAQLHSDHIVRVFDSGRAEHGIPYIVMEHLTGCDLAQLAAGGQLPVRDTVSYVRQACSALDAAHGRGIVHRDLKPSNLFLATVSSGPPVIKVLDFGVSTHGLDSPESLTLTQTNALLGSPRYMSPEQIRSSSMVDARTDIWSLGVILYELLTGRLPFPQRTIAALSVAIATEAPEAPRKLRRVLTAELEAIVMRCLSKDPARRYPSAAALSEALANQDDPASPTRRTRRAVGWSLVAAVSAAMLASWALTHTAPGQSSVPHAIQQTVPQVSATPAPGPAQPDEAGAAAVAASEPPSAAASDSLPQPPAKQPSRRRRLKTALLLPAAEPKTIGPTDTPD